MDGPDIAVIGGGIAGASVAWHLSERTDREVVVYERGEVAGETTAKSAAFFGFYGSAVEERLKRYGMALYNDFFADPRADPRYDLVGRLRVATTEDGASRLEAGEKLGAEAGRETRSLESAAIKERVLCPELDAGPITGARYRPGVGYYRPRELAAEFVVRARENGVAFETGRTVEDVLLTGGGAPGDRVEGVIVDGERVEVEAVVAAGPWNPGVAAMAGIDLPIHHSLAPAMVLDREMGAEAGAGTGPGMGAGTALPIVTHVESGAYARDHGDGEGLVAQYPTDPDPAARFDPAEMGEAVPVDAREEMETFLATLLPSLVEASALEEWGRRPLAHAGRAPDRRLDKRRGILDRGVSLLGAPACARRRAGRRRSAPLRRSHGPHQQLPISRFDVDEDARFSIS